MYNRCKVGCQKTANEHNAQALTGVQIECIFVGTGTKIAKADCWTAAAWQLNSMHRGLTSTQNKCVFVDTGANAAKPSVRQQQLDSSATEGDAAGQSHS